MNRSVGEVVVLVRGADQRGPLAVPVFPDKLGRPGLGRRLGHGFLYGQLHRTLRPAPQAAAKKQKQWHRQKRRKARVASGGAAAVRGCVRSCHPSMMRGVKLMRG